MADDLKGRRVTILVADGFKQADAAVPRFISVGKRTRAIDESIAIRDLRT